MIPMKLHYRDRYRLWADLIRGSTDRLFVASDARPPIGSTVPLAIHIDELSLPIVTRAIIVGWRAQSERFSRGVFVRVSADELEKCRRFLGLRPADITDSGGRSALRVRLDATIQLAAPHDAKPATLVNISEVGLLLHTEAELSPGERIGVELRGASAEAPITLNAEVSWRDMERHVVALRIVTVADDGARILRDQIGAVAQMSDEQQRATRPILVADDDPAILKFLAAALARHGAEVYQASSGGETLRLARELRPALVVMDILMPGVDGADVCKAMRADAELVDVPVIFVSALDPQTLHQVADEAGATDYLLKPVALSDLFNVVGRYLMNVGEGE